MTAEEQRLEESRERQNNWKRWGPYLSERAWGTVREDYSADGTAWDYFPHDHARSRAYRWSEDGLAGICDRHQRLCFALALWNGSDPILKERLFGLTGNEGNHGEDVKEYYFYLDSTPTHSYMKCLYKYPQAAFPYAQLVDENRAPRQRRSRSSSCSTPASSTTTATSTSSSSTPRLARRHPDPHHGRQPRPRARRRSTCCRRSGSATPGPGTRGRARPALRRAAARRARRRSIARAPSATARRWLYCRGRRRRCSSPRTRRTRERLFGVADAPPYVKDGFNDYVVARRDATRSTRRSAAPRRRRTTARRSPPAASDGRPAAALADAVAERAEPFGRTSTRSFDARAARGRRVLRDA